MRPLYDISQIKTGAKKMKNKIEKIKTIDGHEIDADAVINRMDDEIRELLHSKFAGEITEQEFYEKYCAAHAIIFNEEFIVN